MRIRPTQLAIFAAILCALSGAQLAHGQTPALVSLDIEPEDFIAVPVGQVIPFTATGTYSDGSTADLTSSVTWTADDPTIVQFSSPQLGAATSLAIGNTTVTATLGSVSASTNVDVANLSSIEVQPLYAVLR